MKKLFSLIVVLAVSLAANAQGGNTRMGGPDGDFQSLAERVNLLEKKNDAFNVYFNYAASAQASEDADAWSTGFANKQLRLEIKGNLTDKISYRLRHRLNRSNAEKGEDHFAKATDIMMVGYKFSDKLSLMGGKMCQIWGGFEYDENPMYIYEYSDMLNNMDIFMAGVMVSYQPVPTQEIAIEISDANNGKLDEDYGGPVVAVGKDYQNKTLTQARNPLTCIMNWNGAFLGNRLQTRWAWGLQTQARGAYSRMITLGQRLNLKHLQWYFDYMGAWDDMDRLGIATSDALFAYYLPVNTPAPTHGRFAKVHYHSLVTKLNWQFAPQWNLMLKGMFERASLPRIDVYRNYRKSMGYIGSLEYYPDRSQDLRVFLAYVGRKYDFSERCGLADYHTSRIELGFMYRIKCY